MMDEEHEDHIMSGPIVDTVYECWVEKDKASFNKYVSDDVLGLTTWLMGNLQRGSVGTHLHIVIHTEDEYA